MTIAARQYAQMRASSIEVPKLPKIKPAEAEWLPLLATAVRREQTRNAYRLAELKEVGDKLPLLEGVVRVAMERGAQIDIDAVRLSSMRYGPSQKGRGTHAVVLCAQDTLSEWRRPIAQNAIASALLESGYSIVYVNANEGSTVTRDRVVFMDRRVLVETTCMREWVLDAIHSGHITAATPGQHPAMDTGKPLRDPAAQGAAQPA